jgi:hypothetical protein
MARVQTELNGITTTSAYKDGDMRSCVNLRKKNGTLQPALSLRQTGSLQGDFYKVFLHDFSGAEVLLGIEETADGGSAVYSYVNDAVKITLVGTAPEKINSIESVGRIITLVADAALYYVIKKGDAYVWLGKLPDLPVIRFDTVTNNVDNVVGRIGSLGTTTTVYRFSDFIELLRAAENTGISSYKNSGGVGFFDCFLLRYTIKLYDGSYIKPSSPLFIMPNSSLYDLKRVSYKATHYYISFSDPEEAAADADGHKWVIGANDDPTDDNYPGASAVNRPTYSYMKILPFTLSIQYDISSLSAYSEIIEGVDIFITKPLGISAADNVANDVVGEYILKSLDYNSSTIVRQMINSAMQSGKSAEVVNLLNLNNYSSEEERKWLVNNTINRFLGKDMLNNASANYNEQLVIGINEQNKQDISEASVFYHVKSLKLDDPTKLSGTLRFPDTEEDMRLLDNLIYREQLPEVSLSNHSVGAAGSYKYNQRINLYNTSKTWFAGHPLLAFSWRQVTEQYNGIPPTAISDVITSSDWLYLEVELNVDGEKRYVRSPSISPSYFNGKVFTQAYLSYPDTRATRIRLVREWTDTSGMFATRYKAYSKSFDFPLVPHKFLNIAYYINWSLATTDFINLSAYENFKRDICPIGQRLTNFNAATSEGIALINPPEAIVTDEKEESTIRSSELNNPLYYPDKNVYQVGGGKILGLISNAKDVSEGQFGQYPMYAFSTEGVYSLGVGSGDVAFSAVGAPRSYEQPVSGVLCQSPYGVFFLSRRGLCIIAGGKVDIVSYPVEEAPQQLELTPHPYVDDVIPDYGAVGFIDFLRGVELMIYDAAENELIIVNTLEAYSWVYNLDSKHWRISTERISGVVDNAIEKPAIFDGTVIKELGEYEELVSASFITRPLRYGTEDFKKAMRMYLRGQLVGMDARDGKLGVAACYVSVDGLNFQLWEARTMQAGSRKDMDMKLSARTKARYYLFSFGGQLRASSYISHLETETGKEYNNDKMR